jgi:two-component system, OmpR family, sensor kinase
MRGSVEAQTPLAQRQLELLEALMRMPGTDLRTTLTHASDLVAAATGADKIDAFLYDAARDSLAAVGTSTQPLSSLQRQLGLDVLPVSNGGRVVYVYQTGKTFVTGRLQEDPEELRGIKEGLKIQSKLGVPLQVGGERRGMMMIASLKPDFFDEADARLAETIGQWLGILVHRAELAEEIARSAAEEARRTAAEELITVLAHDLRNYLQPLHMRLDLLRRRAERDRRQDDAKDADAAGKVLARLGALISDLLDVARIDQGLFDLRLQPFDLGVMVGEAAAALSTPERSVAVTVQEGSPIMVLGDRSRLRQCVDNLVANAVQKSPAQAVVSVFIRLRERRPDGPRAIVEVIDQGPGIPKDLLPRLFDRFVSGNRPGTSGGGLGLGLYLAKRIAEQHGGDLVAESPPGSGARFCLSLPAQMKQD